MTGIVFIVCVPSQDFEKCVRKKKSVSIKENYKQQQKLNLFPSRRPSLIDSTINKSNNLEETYGFLGNSLNKDNYEYDSMQKLVEDILKYYNLEKTTASHTVGDHYVQFIFSTDVGDKCEEILNILREHDVGIKYESSISIIPCSLYYEGREKSEENAFPEGNNIQPKREVEDNVWRKFVSSVRARLTVAEISEVIKSEAALTFDFLIMLIIASILCACGLVENEIMYLLPSMIICPMIGPVMAGTFGTVIRDGSIMKLGVQSELIGLGIATIVGFCCGTVICLSTNKYGEGEWPTNEMISRGEVRTFGVGCLVALLSGGALTIGIVSDRITSLVAVAISTSLMIPAVNAGLLWSMAIIYYITGDETTRFATLTYTEYYSTDRFMELIYLGTISICLTFVNIFCIYIGGILVFKVKEVAPITLNDDIRSKFWKDDIKIARGYNKTIKKEDLKKILGNKQLHHSCECIRDHTAPSSVLHTWTCCKENYKRPTVKELQDLYVKIKENNLKTSTPPNDFHKLAGLFSSENVPSPIADQGNKNKEKQKIKNVHKFIVTPCNLDHLQ